MDAHTLGIKTGGEDSPDVAGAKSCYIDISSLCSGRATGLDRGKNGREKLLGTIILSV